MNVEALPLVEVLWFDTVTYATESWLSIEEVLLMTDPAK